MKRSVTELKLKANFFAFNPVPEASGVIERSEIARRARGFLKCEIAKRPAGGTSKTVAPTTRRYVGCRGADRLACRLSMEMDLF